MEKVNIKAHLLVTDTYLPETYLKLYKNSNLEIY